MRLENVYIGASCWTRASTVHIPSECTTVILMRRYEKVRKTGLEPAIPRARDFKSRVYTVPPLTR